MKSKKLLLLIFTLLFSALLLASCGDEGSDVTEDSTPTHTHSYEATVTEPTCTTEGFTTYTCECGHSYVDDTVPITHDYTSHSKVKVAAKCEEPGVLERFCQCGASITEEIAPTGHNYTMSKTISTLSCTTDGVTEKKCSCGHTDTITVKAEGHDLVTTVTPATCFEDGLSSTKCNNCNLANSEEILYAHHNVGADGKCSVCSKTIWDGVVDTSWYSDSASSFTLTTSAQLAGFASLVNAGNDFSDKTVKLGADIYLGDREWTAIGNKDHAFAGTFDGAGHTVSGFIFREISNIYLGFFGYNKGVIKDVKVDECRVRINLRLPSVNGVNKIFFGAIASYNEGTVQDCDVDISANVTLTAGFMNHCWTEIGGVVGGNLAGGVVSKSTSSGSITFGASNIESLQLEIGGVVAYGYETSIISGCESGVSVSYKNTKSASNNNSTLCVGGFIGYNEGEINSSFATGDIVSVHTVYSSRGYDIYTGGFAGYCSNKSSISNCYATGNIDVKTDASNDTNHFKTAGFAGYSAGNISRAYATGNVSAELGENSHSVMGGFVGQLAAALIEECYCVGEVSNVSTEEAISGGFVGYLSENGEIKNCYETGKVYQKTSGYTSALATFAGGFIGVAYGTVTNCYATGNVMLICEGDYYARAAGLIASLTHSTVTACFSSGDVYSKGTKKSMSGSYNYASPLLAELSNSSFSKCYYRKDADLTTQNSVNVTFTHSGTPLGLGSFMTIAFIEKTLGWSPDVWNASDEALPTLKFFD